MKEQGQFLGRVAEKLGLTRNVIEAKFIDEVHGGEVAAVVSAATKEGLVDVIGTTRGYLSFPDPDGLRPGGHVRFALKRVVKIPGVGGLTVREEDLGKTPGGFRRALEVLPGEMPEKGGEENG